MKKSIKKIQLSVLTVSLAAFICIFAVPLPGKVSAQAQENNPNPEAAYCKESAEERKKKSLEEQLKDPCVTSDIEDFKKNAQSNAQANRGANCSGVDCGGLVAKYINPFIKLVAAIAGIIMALSLVWAAIQYSSAGGDPNKVAEAKNRISTTVISLIIYIFSVSILEWLIPGNIIL